MSAESLRRAESDLYRAAVIDLYCRATDTSRRKTIDKTEIAHMLECVINSGNDLSRRAKAYRKVA